MPRAVKSDPRLARVRRERALDRAEIRGPSQQRIPSAGIMSFAVKAQDPHIRSIVDEYLAKQAALCVCAEDHDRPYWTCPKHGNVTVES